MQFSDFLFDFVFDLEQTLKVLRVTEHSASHQLPISALVFEASVRLSIDQGQMPTLIVLLKCVCAVTIKLN